MTIVVSVLSAPKADSELKGLVYGLTPHESDHALAWYMRPAVLGVLVLLTTAVLNVIFW